MDERHLISPNREEETMNGQDPGMMWMLGPVYLLSYFG